MFSMGGSTGSGITSGLKRRGYYKDQKGGRVKDGLTSIDEVARGAEMYFPRMKKMAEEQGLYGTSRRLPRFLTQFGLNLMGMSPQGNIFQTAALAARDPYAAYASGKDQESMEQRKLNQAILGDAWEMSAGVQAAKLKGSGGKKAYQLQELEILEERTKENNRLGKENEQLDIELESLQGHPMLQEHNKERIKEINDKKSNNGEIIEINTKLINQIVGEDKKDLIILNAILDAGGTLKDFEEYKKTGKLPENMKEGGRAGYRQGLLVDEQETITGQMPKPMGPAGAQTSQVQPMDFSTLRARLPREITDDIVKLLAESEQALTDFANIRTQEDVDQFNQTYNVSLVLPQEA
jgi:hypothetical protein